MSRIAELECDIAKPVQLKKDPFRISAPKQIASAEEAEAELFSFNKDYWTASHLKKRGKSIKDIYDHFKGLYTQVEISYMLDKVITVNNFMTNRDATILRQQMMEELDDLEKVIWSKEDTDGLDAKDVKVLLQIKDRKILLQGLAAPEKVEIDINHTISDANEKLANSFDRFIKMRQNSIDITPKIDQKNSIKSPEKGQSASEKSDTSISSKE